MSSGLPESGGRERGSFTGSFDWIADPPMRCELTFAQLCDLLRLAAAGQTIPIYNDVQDLISDLALVGNNEIRKWQRSAEHEQAAGLTARRSADAVWRGVFAAGKRLTLRTADVRNALEVSR